MLGVSACLRYQLAIPIAENDVEAHHLSLLSLIALLGSVLLVAVFMVFGREQLASMLNAPALASWFLLLPLSLLVYGLLQILTCRSLRAKRFTTLSSSRIAQALAMTVCQLLAAPLGMVGLLFGQIAGQSSAFLVLLRKDHSEGQVAATTANTVLTAQHETPPDSESLRATAKRYRRFPLYSTWGGMFNVIGQQAPPLLLAAWYSPAAAGFYALAQRLLSMPMTVIGSAVAEVFLSGAKEAITDGSIGGRIQRVHKLMAELAIPPLIVLMLSGPELFAFAFGSDWREAGLYSAWLAPMLYIVFVTSPLSTLMTALNRENEHTLFQSILLAVRLLSLWAGTLRGDAVFAIACFSIASTLVWAGFLLRVFALSGNRVSSALTDTLQALLRAILICSPLIIADFFGLSGTLRTTALLIVAVFILVNCLRLISTLRKK